MRTIALLSVVVSLVSIGHLMAVEKPNDPERSGFDRILERVIERDESTDAIVAVAALTDAPDPAAELVLTIKPLGPNSNVLVELRDPRDRNTVYESYRFKASDRITAEGEKLKKPKTITRAVKARPNFVLLKVPHLAQGKNLCAPASASMVLQYYGQSVSQEKVKELANSVTKNPDFAGTYYIDIVNGLKKIGVEWTHREYKADAAGFEAGMNDLIKSLDAGRPVIIDTQIPPDGHTLVVNGYDQRRKLISLVDPLIPAPGLRQIGYEEFIDIWRSLTVDSRGAMFTQPAKK